MTAVTLSSAFRAARPPRAPAQPLLDPAGAAVVLGDHIGSDGLPAALAPRRDTLFGPRGVCFVGDDGPLVVADTGHHRLLIWRRAPELDNAPADIVIGQPDFTSEGRNARGAPRAWTLNMPTGIASDGNVLAVADAWNNRVLIWRGVPDIDNHPADLVLGQSDFASNLANRGQRRPGPDTLNWCYGVTIADNRLFVADTGNRRVLVWNGLPTRSGQPADLVLGQEHMDVRDDSAGRATGPTGMRWPHAIAVADGRIMVADAGHSRIMVWTSAPNANGAPCAFSLGQKSKHESDRNHAAWEPDERALNMPYGIAAHAGRLICVDTANSRLVGFALGGLAQDAAATMLSGQADFSLSGDNRWRFAARDSVCWPFGLAVRDSLVAVADTGNNRVLLWRRT